MNASRVIGDGLRLIWPEEQAEMCPLKLYGYSFDNEGMATKKDMPVMAQKRIFCSVPSSADEVIFLAGHARSMWKITNMML